MAPPLSLFSNALLIHQQPAPSFRGLFIWSHLLGYYKKESFTKTKNKHLAKSIHEENFVQFLFYQNCFDNLKVGSVYLEFIRLSRVSGKLSQPLSPQTEEAIGRFYQISLKLFLCFQSSGVGTRVMAGFNSI